MELFCVWMCVRAEVRACVYAARVKKENFNLSFYGPHRKYRRRRRILSEKGSKTKSWQTPEAHSSSCNTDQIFVHKIQLSARLVLSYSNWINVCYDYAQYNFMCGLEDVCVRACKRKSRYKYTRRRMRAIRTALAPSIFLLLSSLCFRTHSYPLYISLKSIDDNTSQYIMYIKYILNASL